MAMNKKKSSGDENGRTPRRVKLYFSGEADTPAERMAAIRQLRKGQILNYLLHNGPASRVDVSRKLGFNLRTVSLLVAALIADNIIIEKPVKVSTSMGRRPVPLELNANAGCVMGIDVGRYRTGMALLDLQGRVLVRDDRPSDFSNTPEEQATWLVAAANEFLKSHHGDLPPLAGAGISFEGFVFQQHVARRHSAVTESICKALEDSLGVPVSSDTDSRLAAIAEQWFGTVRGGRNAIIFNISDGLGLGCIVGGKLLSGSHGFAGEIGHVPLGEPGIPCHCGSSGCLENIVSGSGLARLAAESGIFPDEASFDIKRLAELSQKDEKARQVLEKFSKHLALAIVMADNIFDPEAIVLGGPMAPYVAAFKDLFIETAQKSAVPFIMEKTRIEFSTLGEDAILLGAGGQILNHIYSASHVAAESLL